MEKRIETRVYNLAKMSGCVQGNVPDITPEEALTSGLAIKVVNTTTLFPIYADLTAIDYGTGEFTLEPSHDSQMILRLDEHKFFYNPKLNLDVTRTLNGCLIVGNELFTVIHDDPIPIWMGDNSLIYYADDIQNLINSHGSYNVLW